VPEDAYRRPILEALGELGGSGRVRDVLEIVERKMRSIFSDVDYQRLKSGEIRWYNTACFVRQGLKEEGLLESESPHGVWELSAMGKRELG